MRSALALLWFNLLSRHQEYKERQKYDYVDYYIAQIQRLER